jgi:hypothetical protein
MACVILYGSEHLTVARINRNRLHLLLSTLCGLVAIGCGFVLLSSAYSTFANGYTRQQYIQMLEKRTGKSYAQWQQEQSVICTKEFAESKETQEQKELLYRICMSIPVMVPVPASDVMWAFSIARAHWVLGYIFSAIVVAWLAGFLIAKAIPTGTSRFWTWLTSSGKAQ